MRLTSVNGRMSCARHGVWTATCSYMTVALHKMSCIDYLCSIQQQCCVGNFQECICCPYAG